MSSPSGRTTMGCNSRLVHACREPGDVAHVAAMAVADADFGKRQVGQFGGNAFWGANGRRTVRENSGTLRSSSGLLLPICAAIAAARFSAACEKPLFRRVFLRVGSASESNQLTIFNLVRAFVWVLCDRFHCLRDLGVEHVSISRVVLRLAWSSVFCTSFKLPVARIAWSRSHGGNHEIGNRRRPRLPDSANGFSARYT